MFVKTQQIRMKVFSLKKVTNLIKYTLYISVNISLVNVNQAIVC